MTDRSPEDRLFEDLRSARIEPGQHAVPARKTVRGRRAGGLLVVGLDRQVLHADRAAVARMRAFGMGIDETLRFTAEEPLTHAQFAAALIKAVRLERSVFLLDHGRDRLTVEVEPLRIEGPAARAGGAMIRFDPPSATGALNAEDLASTHSLTRAEASVLDGLGRGLRAKEVAGTLGLSIATVRTHLRNIYRKTGARDMQALVAMLAARGRNGSARASAARAGSSRPPSPPATMPRGRWKVARLTGAALRPI